MTIEVLEELMRPLALAGLIIGTVDYYALVRRRKREADEAQEQLIAASSARTRARFRHLRRHDDE